MRTHTRWLIGCFLLAITLAFTTPTFAAEGDPPPAASTETSNSAPSPSPGSSPDPGQTQTDAGPKEQVPAAGDSQEPAPEPTPAAAPAPRTSSPAPKTAEPEATDSTEPAPEPTSARGSARAADTTCTPRDQSGSLNSITLSDTTADVNQVIRVDFTGALPATNCPGDTVRIGVSAELYVDGGSYPVKDPRGALMGQMVVTPASGATPGSAVITFNDYLATHQNVTYKGFLQSTLSDTLQPGTRYEMQWPVGGKVITTPIETNPCTTGCDTPRESAHKWAVLRGQTVHFALESAPTRTADETVTFTDHLDASQQVDCTSIQGHIARIAPGRNTLEWVRIAPVSVSACGTDPNQTDNPGGYVVAGTMQATEAGQYLVMTGAATITDVTLSEYRDWGTVSRYGETTPVSATARRNQAGAEGDGNQPPPPVVYPPTTPPVTPPATPPVTPPVASPPPAVSPPAPHNVVSAAGAPATAVAAPAGVLPATGTPTGVYGLTLGGFAALILGAATLLAARRRS